MKTWMMPRVDVEAFRANEYVAGSCHEDFKTNESLIHEIYRSNSWIDWNGTAYGSGTKPQGYSSISVSSSLLNEWHGKQGLHGPYRVGVECKGSVTSDTLDTYKDNGYIFGYYYAEGAYFMLVDVYNTKASGGENWHPVGIVEQDVDRS